MPDSLPKQRPIENRPAGYQPAPPELCGGVILRRMMNRKTYIPWLLVTLTLAHAQSRPAMTREIFDQWMTELSNWGRWGKEDELGAVNLITAAKRKQAAALVREGASYSLARNAEKEKAPDNPAPFLHVMTRTGINNPGTSVGDTYTIT